MIKSLYIRNYKLFKELRIESLVQVNLVIGKNNVGKTSLLEAIMLFSYDNNIVNNIFNILRLRKVFSDAKLSSQQLLEILSTLFHNRTCVFDEAIFIGANEQEGHSIYLNNNNAPHRQSTLVIKQADETVEEILLSSFPQTERANHQVFVSGSLSEPDDFLSLQIFATTHSLDTLWAFQEIAKNDETDAAVIKLQSLPKKNKIKAVNFKTQDIMIAVEQNIEVR
jgi:predicted ATP-dependent endonuclease of OLD family